MRGTRERRQLTNSGRGAARSADAHFPLTPALSLGERENHRLSFGKSRTVEKCETRARLFPLPEGEGKGEGEQGLRDFDSARKEVAGLHECFQNNGHCPHASQAGHLGGEACLELAAEQTVLGLQVQAAASVWTSHPGFLLPGSSSGY
jgi:hypothetical protein